MPVTDELAVAKAIAYGRVGLGLSFLLAPRLALKVWPGPVSGSTTDTQAVAALLARSVGGRDLAIAAGTLLAIRDGTPVRSWLEAGVLADATDALAVIAALGHISKARALPMLVSAVGAALVGRRLATSLG